MLPFLFMFPFLHPMVARTDRIDALAKAGWLGEACVASVGLEHPPEALLAAHLASRPNIVGEVVPGEFFPNAPAYGEQILVAHLLYDEDSSSAPVRQVRLTPVIAATGETWLSCTFKECPDDWVRERLGFSPRPADQGDSQPWKNVLGIFALGGAMLWDVTMSPVRAMQAFGEGPVSPSASGWVIDHMLPGPHPSVGEITVPASERAAAHLLEDASCPTDGPCLDVWVGHPEFGGPAPARDAMRVSWKWRHDGCAVWATWELPMGSEGAFPERLAAALSKPVQLSERPVARWGVDAP